MLDAGIRGKFFFSGKAKTSRKWMKLGILDEAFVQSSVKKEFFLYAVSIYLTRVLRKLTDLEHWTLDTAGLGYSG